MDAFSLNPHSKDCPICGTPLAISNMLKEIDRDRIIVVGEERRPLTHAEWQVYRLLRAAEGRMLTKGFIISTLSAYDDDEAGWNWLNNLISRLRTKLRGSGYAINHVSDGLRDFNPAVHRSAAAGVTWIRYRSRTARNGRANPGQ